MAEGFLGNGKSRQDQSPFSERGWVNQVDDYLRFMHQPISRAMSSSRIILRCHDAYLCLILQLGGVGVLEEIWAFALGDYRTEPKPEEAIPMLQSLVDDTHDFLHDGEVRNNALAVRFSTLREIIIYLSVILAGDQGAQGRRPQILPAILRQSQHPRSDRLPRQNQFERNSSSFGERQRSEIPVRHSPSSLVVFSSLTIPLGRWSRAIYDATMAMYYGPPNFKAYYRRGLALAHLKMWKKAIAGQSSFLQRPVIHFSVSKRR